MGTYLRVGGKYQTIDKLRERTEISALGKRIID